MHENILAKNPSADLSVYVVWLPILATDARSEVDRSLIDDRRVRHFWDGERVAGEFFANSNVGDLGSSGIVWDAFYVFGPGARWQATPDQPTGSGSPVISKTDELEMALKPLL